MGPLVPSSFLCDSSSFEKLVDWKPSFHICEGFSFPTTTFLDCIVEIVQNSRTGRRQSQELHLKFSFLTRPVYASPFGYAPHGSQVCRMEKVGAASDLFQPGPVQHVNFLLWFSQI